MTNLLATKCTVYASKEASARDEWAIHTQCKRMNLQRAKSLDYMLLVRDGKVVDVAKVYDAEPEPDRWGWNGKPVDRVAFIVGPQVPPEIEALIDTPLTWEGANPNVYFTMDDEGTLTRA